MIFDRDVMIYNSSIQGSISVPWEIQKGSSHKTAIVVMISQERFLIYADHSGDSFFAGWVKAPRGFCQHNGNKHIRAAVKLSAVLHNL